MVDSLQMLEVAVKAADLKRAEDILAYDVSKMTPLADYYMICHGNSGRQVEAITNEIIDQVESIGGVLRQLEGKSKGSWMLIDFGDLVVHVFTEEDREFYQVEKLWLDGDIVDIDQWVDE